jgi:hypothetical protein
MPVTATPVSQTPAKYPSLEAGAVPFSAYQTIRLLWDQVYALKDRLTAAEATNASLIATVNALETRLTGTTQTADDAVAIRQEP